MIGLKWSVRRLWLILGGTIFLPVVLGIMGLGAMLMLALGKPPLVLVEAETGFLSYRVQRADLSSFILQGAEITDTASFCSAGLDAAGKVLALVRPTAGTTVEYHWLPDLVKITLQSEPADTALIEGEDGTQCRAASGDLTFLVPSEALRRRPPLPILGSGQIGVELGVPTFGAPLAACRSEELKGQTCIDNGNHEVPVINEPNPTLHRATARLFGRTSMVLSGGQLYPITDGVFPVPGGSRLQASEESSPFIGSVTLSDDGLSLRAQVTVEANNLRLFRAGQTQQAEVLATGVIARAFSDPSLGPLLILATVIAFFLQLAVGVRSMVKGTIAGSE